MRITPRVAILAAVITLAGCQPSAVFYHRDPSRQVVVLDEREISIISLGKDKWEAYGGKQGGWFGTDADKQKNRQVQAIEKVTGCRVVSTEFPSQDNSQKLLIHATVDCTR